VQGVYVFQLTVTDNQGATNSATVQITVNAGNIPPIANAGSNQTIQLPANTGVLNGNASTDPDGTIVTYAWTKLSGPATYTIVSPSSALTTATGLVQGVYVFQLTVTDNQGAINSATVQITVNAANQPPVANAGPDKTITLPTNSVTLTGSGTDPDGTVTAYLWSKIAGPGQFTIVSPTQAQTVINNLVQGVYQFELKVTDNQGATGRDTVLVTVNSTTLPSNQPPVAHAGLDQNITLPLNSVTLNGSGTDADGTIASYQWSKISGPALYTIVSSTQAQTDINSMVQGVYQFELKVTDNQGATGRDTVIVAVNLPNQPPVAHAGADQTITLPVNSVTLNGTGTDADGMIVSSQWSKIDGPAQFTMVSPAQGQTALNNLAAGIYQFELTVTDNQGATGKDTVMIIVYEEVQTISSAIIFPNPASTVINVSINAKIQTNKTNIIIYDPQGTVVYQEEFMRSQQQVVRQIDISKLTAGFYLVKIGFDADNNKTLKLIKQ
jgi:hypothetical protein